MRSASSWIGVTSTYAGGRAGMRTAADHSSSIHSARCGHVDDEIRAAPGPLAFPLPRRRAAATAAHDVAAGDDARRETEAALCVGACARDRARAAVGADEHELHLDTFDAFTDAAAVAAHHLAVDARLTARTVGIR